MNNITQTKERINPLSERIRVDEERLNQWEHENPHQAIKLVCGSCLKPSLDTVREVRQQLDRTGLSYWRCSSCHEQGLTREAWVKTQAIYPDTSASHDTMRSLREQIVAAENRQNQSISEHGMILYGASGIGKSRELDLTTRVLMCSRPLKRDWLSGGGFRKRMVEAYGNDRASASSVMETMASVDILVIDDLGIEPLRAGLLSDLRWIIDERFTHNRLTYVATNYDNLTDRLAHDANDRLVAVSIVRRLNEQLVEVHAK